MFGFNKKAQQKKQEAAKKKDEKYIDKLVMGAVLGGAIGSILGVGLAPRKGKETREMIAKKSTEILNDVKDGVKKIAVSEEKKGLFKKLTEKLGSSKKIKSEVEAKMKKIPNEIDT